MYTSTQVDPFDPCDKSGIILTTCLFTPVFSVIKELQDFTTFQYFICKIGKGVRKVPSHSCKMRPVFSSTHQDVISISHSFPTAHSGDICDILTSAGKKQISF